jgi:hypothetical protein
LGKYAKTTFPSNDSRSKGILNLIHSDVCGPMSAVSIGGFSYYVSFIDDHSRKTWIYFIKTKDEVFSLFQEFKDLVQNQTERKIKVLRSENGGEYTSNALKEICADSRIKRELTVPYNPQQDGVSKRKNKSIVGEAKAMLHDQDFPMFLWDKACNTAVCLQNRSLHKVLGRMTPEEAFTGKRPEMGHICIFGCLVYCHVPTERKTELEPTAEKGILVGYSENSKAYKVYIHALMRTVVRRDVRFEGDRAFRKSCGQMPADEQSKEQSAPKEEARQPLQTTCPRTYVQVGQQQQ